MTQLRIEPTTFQLVAQCLVGTAVRAELYCASSLNNS